MEEVVAVVVVVVVRRRDTDRDRDNRDSPGMQKRFSLQLLQRFRRQQDSSSQHMRKRGLRLMTQPAVDLTVLTTDIPLSPPPLTPSRRNNTLLQLLLLLLLLSLPLLPTIALTLQKYMSSTQNARKCNHLAGPGLVGNPEVSTACSALTPR